MVQLGAKDAQSEDDIQGNARPLPGQYHVVIKEADESFEKFDKIIVEFEVLAGTTPGQEGRTVNEFFAVTAKALPRLQRLALAIGLLKPGEEERDVSFSEAVGRDLVVEVEQNDYTARDGTEKKGVRIAYLGMWSTGNEAVADVPKDTEPLGLSATEKPATTEEPAAASAAAAAPADKWADL